MKHTIAYLEWEDSVSNDDKWVYTSSAKEWANYDEGIIKQVGFIVEETKDYILIVSRICLHEDVEHQMVRGLIKIPKASIKKKIRLSIK